VSPSDKTVDVYVEIGEKNVFVSALDWPGWTRSGKHEKEALEKLAAYAPRYTAVPKAARITFPAGEPRFNVAERVKGNATTDFGAPAIHASSDVKPLSKEQAQRIAALLTASWKVFDSVVGKAPAELRKGPRGGGRDRNKIADHVIDAESAYASKLGVRMKLPRRDDAAGVRVWRKAIMDTLQASAGAPQQAEKRWPPRYAARRMAWHLLDHAWEIEDRSD
jgi:hypothetical protein